ncbi:hypothetical protein [Amaricoccus sp.]|uniref:hypothetical protein n=1 Tax=Amaricoccus sp. TaxID=1872485 RepID=UPI001B51D9B2|nr:hypothetical protein [Amaricoccus sp.]MBP7001697.1 hypothetical protein [Amaricoccus sp.]
MDAKAEARKYTVPEHLRMSKRGTVHVVAEHEKTVPLNRAERRAAAARKRRGKAAQAAETIAAYEMARRVGEAAPVEGDAPADPAAAMLDSAPTAALFYGVANLLAEIGDRVAAYEGRVDGLLAALGGDPETVATTFAASARAAAAWADQIDALRPRVEAIEARLRGLGEGLGA